MVGLFSTDVFAFTLDKTNTQVAERPNLSESSTDDLYDFFDSGQITKDGVLKNTDFIKKNRIERIFPHGKNYCIEINNNLGQIRPGKYNIIWDEFKNTYIFEQFPNLGRVKVMPGDKICPYQKYIEKQNNRLDTNKILKKVKNGDIVFQTSRSVQSTALEYATHSDITHVGMMVRKNQQWYVIEAVQPVKITHFHQWKQRGENGKISIKRLKDNFDFSKVLKAMEKHLGKDYDSLFYWGDSEIYCSELIYKGFKEGAGIKIGNLTRLKFLDFSSNEVQNLLIKRLGLKMNFIQEIMFKTLLKTHGTFENLIISPAWIFVEKYFSKRTLELLNSQVITPIDMYQAINLRTIYSDYN